MVMVSNDSPLERDRDQWPLFRTRGADHLAEKIRGFCRFVEDQGLPAVVSLYVPPWEFIPVAPSYHFGEATVIPDDFITRGCGQHAVDELGKLIGILKSDGMAFVRAIDLVGGQNAR